jgi:hypothetical protein
VWEISPRRGPTGLLPCYWSRGVIGASSASQCFAATPLTPPEPPENIRTCFEGFRADVEALAEGNPEWDGVLQECRGCAAGTVGGAATCRGGGGVGSRRGELR